MTADVWIGEGELPAYPANIAQMINENAKKFSTKTVYQEVQGGDYVPLSWKQFQKDIKSIQLGLGQLGFMAGDRIAVMSRNRREMLELEMAVMGMGAVFVPIFAGYPPEQANRLVRFCRPKFVVTANQKQFDKIENTLEFDKIIHFDPLETERSANCISLSELMDDNLSDPTVLGEETEPDTVSLMMFTSGTMGKPKCVMLTHRNILSQQAAMSVQWNVNSSDRFLSFLPWHHSFGGIYEKYSAITNGAVLSLEHGYGKNTDILIDNWKKVKPTMFFSVPKVYQEIASYAMQDAKAEKIIFHDELRMVFTAAAPLPKNISDMFEKRNIPIYEGWGLTETSRCCTVTDPKLPRVVGIVGKPIAGVSLALSDEDEILVKGPNVMKGYFDNPEETERVLKEDGWFHTGDIGAFTETGLKLISRKDRIFKLMNAEKVVPSEIEGLVTRDCPYLSHAFVVGSGREHPVVLLFPNKRIMSNDGELSDLPSGCKCTDGCEDLAKCLGHCLKKMNDMIDTKYAKIQGAMLMDYELSIEREELTPSMKLAPNVVARVFEANINALYGMGDGLIDDETAYVIEIEES